MIGMNAKRSQIGKKKTTKNKRFPTYIVVNGIYAIDNEKGKECLYYIYKCH
jgi:hypothetical protein